MAKPIFGDFSHQFQQFYEAGQLASSSRLNQDQGGGYQVGNGLTRQFGPEHQLHTESTRFFPELSQPNSAGPLGQLNDQINLQQYWPSSTTPIVPPLPVHQRPHHNQTVFIPPVNSPLNWSGELWANEFNQANQSNQVGQGSIRSFALPRPRPPTAAELELSPSYSFIPSVIPPSSSAIPAVALSELQDLLRPLDILELQYYLDPEVQNLLESGRAATAVNLFLSNNPDTDRLGRGTVKLLQVLLLDTLGNATTTDPGLLTDIRRATSAAELYQVTRSYHHLLNGNSNFGNVVKIDVAAELAKYQRQHGMATDSVEAMIFKAFRDHYELSLDPSPSIRNLLLQLQQDLKLNSAAKWSDPNAGNSISQQVLDYLLSGQTSLTQPLTDPRVDKLRSLTTSPNPEVATIASNLLKLLPKSRSNSLYVNLMIIADRLEQEPLESIRQFLNSQGLNLGQNKPVNFKITVEQPKSAEIVPHTTITLDQLQELDYYLQPQVQALVHSPLAYQIADDFAADRISNPAALPAGSVDLIKFLLYDLILADRDESSQASSHTKSVQALKSATTIAELSRIYKSLQQQGLTWKTLLDVLRPDLALVYQRYRTNTLLPGDDYLVPYFQKYAETDLMGLQPSTPLDQMVLEFFREEWPRLRGQGLIHSDPIRNNLSAVMLKPYRSSANYVAVNELAKALPHNIYNYVYQTLAEVSGLLGTDQGDRTIMAIMDGDYLKKLGLAAQSNSQSLSQILGNYPLESVRLVSDPAVLAVMQSGQYGKIMAAFLKTAASVARQFPSLTNQTLVKLIQLSLINGLELTGDRFTKTDQDQLVVQILASKDLTTLHDLAIRYSLARDTASGTSQADLTKVGPKLRDRLQRLLAQGNNSSNQQLVKLVQALTKLLSADITLKVVGRYLSRIVKLLEDQPNQAEAISQFLTQRGVNLTIDQPIPLAAAITTNYAEVVASRQFVQQYRDFLAQPNQGKAKFLLNKLKTMTNLILTQPLEILPGYDQLNTALAKIKITYLPNTRAEL